MRQHLRRRLCASSCGASGQDRGTGLNISGMEKVDYFDIIREIRRVTGPGRVGPYSVGFFPLTDRTRALFDESPVHGRPAQGPGSPRRIRGHRLAGPLRCQSHAFHQRHRGNIHRPDLQQGGVEILKQAGKRVAIVGAGPMGLAAAYQLALEGFVPVVFEADDRIAAWPHLDIAGHSLERSTLPLHLGPQLPPAVFLHSILPLPHLPSPPRSIG